MDKTYAIPDELIEGVRQRLETVEGYQWELGDYLVEAADEIIPHLRVKHPRAHLIREIAGRVGCDESTLRDRESMARFYPPHIRAEYEPLTWGQLRACKAAGERWREYAEWALANLPAPVAVIRARIKSNGDAVPAWIGRWEKVIELCDLLARDETADGRVRRIAEMVLREGEVAH